MNGIPGSVGRVSVMIGKGIDGSSSEKSKSRLMNGIPGRLGSVSMITGNGIDGRSKLQSEIATHVPMKTPGACVAVPDAPTTGVSENNTFAVGTRPPSTTVPMMMTLPSISWIEALPVLSVMTTP